MRKVVERILQLLGLLGLPGDLRLLYNILSALVPAVLAGIFAYTEQASTPVLALLVLAAYILFFLASIPITTIISWWKQGRDKEVQGGEGQIGELTAEEVDATTVIKRLTAERDELKSRGIPEHMISERHIRYHPSPIRLVDLLEVAGEDGVLRDFTFEHCILEGPGIINLGGPFPKPETTGSGASGSLSVGPASCRVEGAPETVLYEITPNGKIPIGVIHLAGYTIRDVTFRGLGFAGTPEELERLKEHLAFSEGSAAPASPSAHTASSQATSRLGDEDLKRRSSQLADKLYQFLEERGHGEGVEVDDPNDPEMVRRSNETIGLYRRRRLEGEVMALYEALKQRGLWGEEISDEFGRNRATKVAWYEDIQVIAQRLSTIGHRL